jgi:signal transduction histidine kinase
MPGSPADILATMEIFTLAAVSLIISISILLRRDRGPILLSFAALCFTVFLHKWGQFFGQVTPAEFWNAVSFLGLLGIPPLAVAFFQNLVKDRRVLRRRDAAVTALVSLALGAASFTPFRERYSFTLALEIYVIGILLVCLAALILFTLRRMAGPEKKRFLYLTLACTAAFLLSMADLFQHLHGAFPPLSNIFIAVLLYFVLMFVTHPQMAELREIMARTLFLAIITITLTLMAWAILRLFSAETTPPFTHLMVASFLIVIAIEPLREILKKLFTLLFPHSRELLRSLFAFDEKLEREKSLLLEEMAPVFAHEIRNPLGSIKGAAQYLRSEVNSEENLKLLDVIIEEVNRLNRVVSQFLNFARPYRPDLKPQDINRVIERAVDVIRANILSEKIAIQTDLRPELPVVNADPEQLVQVILNIAMNAIEAMPEGGTLTLRTRRIESDEGDAVAITIRDTGPGIRREDMKNIFKPFFTTKERGVGLGLAICQRIMRGHGGHIRAKSLPGRGSIFIIRVGLPS